MVKRISKNAIRVKVKINCLNLLYPSVSALHVCPAWLRSWLARQDVWGSISSLAATISEIGYLLLPSGDMTEI